MIIRSTRVIFPFHSCFPLVLPMWKQLWNELMPITKDAHLCKPERYSWLIDNFTCIAAIARANQPEALPMK